MRTLILAAAVAVGLGVVPAYADDEASSTEAQVPAKAQQPHRSGYLYGTPNGPPTYLYSAQQKSQGTWLFPPNPSMK